MISAWNMTLDEYNKMMEEKGTPKVWIVDSGHSGSFVNSQLFATEEEARREYDSIPKCMYREIRRTWDIWGWTERMKKRNAVKF